MFNQRCSFLIEPCSSRWRWSIRSKQSHPEDSNLDYLETNNFYQSMMESYPDTILLLNDLGASSYHLVERYSCHQRLHSHTLKLQEVRFWCSKYDQQFLHPSTPWVWESQEQTHNRTITFTRGTCVSLWRHLFHRHQHDLLPTHIHFQNYRPHQCERIFRQKTEFFRCLPFRNLFEASLQTVSVWSFDHRKVMIRGYLFIGFEP